MAAPLVDHVVADAGAFLKNVALQDFGRNIYTLRDVVEEIRDKQTRRSLAFLPYQLQFKEPHPEHVRHVTEFSKKTGDYPSLSATDIKVLALTYQLELEHVGSEHLRTKPEIKVNIHGTQRHPETPVNIAGFHLPHKQPNNSKINKEHCIKTDSSTSHDEFNSFQFWREPMPSITDDLLEFLDSGEVVNNGQTQTSPLSTAASENDEFNTFQFWREPLLPLDDSVLGLLNGDSYKTSGDNQTHNEEEENELDEEEEKQEKEEDDDDDDDDGGGWITPSNIRNVKMESADGAITANVKVGCLTTDFAMQNVLIQIGLHVLSVNGMLIKQARNYILRCHACFKTTSNMNKVFCQHCGNKTLKKIAVTICEDGSMKMHFSTNPKVMNPRGMRYSLPQPQGGKHANNPQLVEDQPCPQQRLSQKARQKNDVFNPDYLAKGSPFCENDIYSRAANLHIRDGRCGGGRRRANPNAARKKFVKKK